jgi:hypothetical protein
MNVFMVTQYVINETRIMGIFSERDDADFAIAYARNELKNFGHQDIEAIYEVIEIEVGKIKLWEAFSHE